MTPETIALALLVFAMVATRLWEEGRWRAGVMTDRTAALLVVGRLPLLGFGFSAIVGLGVAGVLLFTGAGLGLAALAYPWVVGRLRRSSRAPRG